MLTLERRRRAGGRPVRRGLERAARVVDVGRLEQRDRGAAVRRVVAGRVEQARQQQRAHHALLLAERVLEPEHRLVAEAQRARARAARRTRRRCTRTARGRAAGPPARRRSRWLGVSRPTAARRAGSVVGSLSRPCTRATSSIRSASRCTSLSRQGGTVTPTRPSSARGSKPSRSRIPRSLVAAGCSSRAAAPMRSRRSSAERGDCGLRVHVDRARHEARPAQLDHQARREPLGGDRLLGVQLLLEARGRLGAQPERLGGPHDVRPDPGGRLHQHAGGVVGHLRHLAAHDPGDPARPLGVADERHVARRRRARRRRA